MLVCRKLYVLLFNRSDFFRQCVTRQLGRSRPRSSNLILSVVQAFGAEYNRASRDTRMILPAKFRQIFLAVVLAPIAAFAHHAYTAEFDTTKPVKLSGVLTRVDWSNPHIWIYLDVKDEK